MTWAVRGAGRPIADVGRVTSYLLDGPTHLHHAGNRVGLESVADGWFSLDPADVAELGEDGAVCDIPRDAPANEEQETDAADQQDEPPG